LKEAGYTGQPAQGSPSPSTTSCAAVQAGHPERYEAQAEKCSAVRARRDHRDERRQELVEIWNKATVEVAKEMELNFPHDNRSTCW